MANRKSTEVSSAEDKNKRIEELEAQLSLLRNEKNGNVEINQTDYIRVMNLFPGVLNLVTKEKGLGKNFRFEDFGKVKRILYSDLIDILEVNSRFVESGYVFILDPRVIRVHGLEDAYSKILTKDKIDKIISGSPDADELYASCNTNQQRLIVTMLIEKVRDNPESVDLNMVDRISRLSGINITQKAHDAREYFGMNEKEEEKSEK